MATPAPEWLSRRGGSVKLASDNATRYVLLAGSPQYALTPRPAGGKFGCAIKQTNNGKPIPSAAAAGSADDAIAAGLEDLRKHLGW